MQRITGSPFIDGVPATNTKGTTVTAAWLNAVQEELAGVVELTGGALSGADNLQVAKGIQSQKLVTSVAGGTADALTGTFTPAITTLTPNMVLYVRAASANATASPTFTPNSGVIAPSGMFKGANAPLVIGDIAGAGHGLKLRWDATLTKWELMNPATGISPTVSTNIGQLKNLFINGGCQIAQRASASLSTSPTYGQVDRFAAWGAGTAVSAGTITQDTASPIGRTGYALKLAGVTITGAGVALARQRIESINARRLKNQTASFSVQVYHDVGPSINFLITIRKPTAADNYTGTTTIATSSAIAVPNAAGTQITLPNVAMGDCSNGIEIEVQAQCGAVTTKNISFTEWQIEEGQTISSFERREVVFERQLCQRYYEQTYDDGVAAGAATRTGLLFIGYRPVIHEAGGGGAFRVPKRVAPTMAYWDGAGNSNKASYRAMGVWYDNTDTVTAVLSSTNTYNLAIANGSGNGNANVHFTANAEL